MSIHEWEAGTVTLPSADVAPFRRALVARNNLVADEALDFAKVAWGRVPPRGREDPRSVVVSMSTDRRVDPNVQRRAQKILNAYYTSGAPRAPLKKNAGHLRQSESTFIDVELSLVFEGNTLAWDVPSNNHAVDHSRESWIGQELFAQLDAVRWTRGTGGVFVGNNEYNEDDTSAGGGANYVSVAWGPYGRRTHPRETRPYTTSMGVHVSERELLDLAMKRPSRR